MHVAYIYYHLNNEKTTNDDKKVEGTLSVQPQANPVKGFEEYFLNLNVENNRRNPWFVGAYTFYFIIIIADVIIKHEFDLNLLLWYGFMVFHL